jgi:hypothetical protein
MKKIISLVLSAILTLSLGVAAYATEEEAMDNGTTNNTLSIVAENCNVRLSEASGNIITYDYNSNLFDVSTTTVGDITTISASKKPGVNTGLMDAVEIDIPTDMFTAITVDINSAGVSLPSLNIDIDVICIGGSVSFSPPSGYNKNFNANLTSSAGSLAFSNGASNFSIEVNATTSSVSVPSGWNRYIPGTKYEHTAGNGTAEFNITLNMSSYAINQL